MAVAFDAAPTPATANNVSSVSWSHTCSGGNRLLAVGVAVGLGVAATNSVTFNGDSLAEQWDLASANSACRCAGYYMIAPDVGTFTVAVTLAFADNIVGGSVSFTGVDQADPIGTPATAQAASAGPATVNVSSATGEMVFNCMAARFASQTGNQTERWNTSADGGGLGGAGQTAAGATSVTCSWTLGDGTGWVTGGFSVQADQGLLQVSVAEAVGIGDIRF